MFLKGEGLQLMNLMLREKRLSRNGAIRVLDHALTGKVHVLHKFEKNISHHSIAHTLFVYNSLAVQ